MGFPKGPSWVFFKNILNINDLDDGIEFTLTKFVDDRRLGRVLNTLEGMDRLENG